MRSYVPVDGFALVLSEPEDEADPVPRPEDGKILQIENREKQ